MIASADMGGTPNIEDAQNDVIALDLQDPDVCVFTEDGFLIFCAENGLDYELHRSDWTHGDDAPRPEIDGDWLVLCNMLCVFVPTEEPKGTYYEEDFF